MVAIVLPRPLPRSAEQEALLCMPEGQEAWLTGAEPREQLKTHTQGYFMFTHFSHCKANSLFVLFYHIS